MATTTTKKKMLRRMRTAVRRCVSVNVLCQGCGGACFLGSAGLVVMEGATDAAPYLRGKMETDYPAPHTPPGESSTKEMVHVVSRSQSRGFVVEQIVSITPGSRRFLSGGFLGSRSCTPVGIGGGLPVDRGRARDRRHLQTEAPARRARAGGGGSSTRRHYYGCEPCESK